MEFVILGLLKFKSMTAYEILSFISKNFSLVCSASAGSVQTALKKLIKSGSVSINEHVEGGINKKVYSISEIGEKNFNEWVVKPMQIDKFKNMELSKLFFLGFTQIEDQIKALKGYVEQLEEAKVTLSQLKEFYLKLNNINITSISDFHEYTLEYGIDSADFQINWYTRLIHRLEKQIENSSA